MLQDILLHLKILRAVPQYYGMFPIQNIQGFSMILVKFFLPQTFLISCGEEDVIILSDLYSQQYCRLHQSPYCKRIRSPGIDSKEFIPRKTGNPFLGSLKGLQIRAQSTLPLTLQNRYAYIYQMKICMQFMEKKQRF
jgi:hypothetical protein